MKFVISHNFRIKYYPFSLKVKNYTFTRIFKYIVFFKQNKINLLNQVVNSNIQC